MSADTIIRAEGLGKKYVLGHQRAHERNPTLRDSIADAARRALRMTSDMLKGRPLVAGDEIESFWALRDVGFEIKRGEVVGVIGRNGAGKSTLLKILSRITEPTTGRVAIGGRVASLLEVGTGFHPELSGRENVYLNGAILGMRRGEIRRRFDEIVDFAGVERFIDTPVKRYSSGMQLRLAFAVAAHLDPEILLVDEVLAVGDTDFQKKCLGKMGEIAGSGGRTVLFVSHQLGMVSRLCPRALLLDGGSIVFDGATNEAIDAHLATRVGASHRAGPKHAGMRDLGTAIVDVKIVDADGVATDRLGWHTPMRIRVQLDIRQPVGVMLLGIGIENRHYVRVTTWFSPLSDHFSDNEGGGVIDLEIPGEILAPGGYSLTVALFEPRGAVHQRLEGECPFVIVDSGSAMAEFSDVDYGVVLIPGRWAKRNLANGAEPGREE